MLITPDLFCLSVWSFAIRCVSVVFFFFQAEDGIRDLVRSRGLGDVYKRQARTLHTTRTALAAEIAGRPFLPFLAFRPFLPFLPVSYTHLTLPTSDLV